MADVEVWWVDLDVAVPPAVDGVLSSSERQRWRAFARPEDARRYLLGAVTVRALAGLRTGTQPSAVVVDRACPDCDRQHGRPVVAGDGFSDLALSVSHSGDLVVVAVGPARLGVDVEHVRPDLPVEDLAPQVLSPTEVNDLSRLDETTRRHRFVELWTAREAALKASGRGLRIDPRGVAVSTDQVVVPGHATLQLHRLDAPAPDHAAALATEPHTRVLVRRVAGFGPDGTLRSA